MTESGIINRLEYVFTCFVAHINADSSNKQTTFRHYTYGKDSLNFC